MARWFRLSERYWKLSTRPLHVLAFLLPLIVLFEVGSNLYLSDVARATAQTIRAQSMLLGFFQEFGVFGRYLPATTIVTVLLVWHLMLRDPWTVNPLVLGGMALESMVWTVPLVVALALVLRLGEAVVPAVQAVGMGGGTGGIESLSREGLATISLGAGLYEELLFRMIGIAILHALFVDLVRMSDRWGTWLAILVSAAAFAVYHDILRPGGGIEVSKAMSLLLAGSYFGWIYISRGFGVVVAVHALYDILVLVVLRRNG